MSRLPGARGAIRCGRCIGQRSFADYIDQQLADVVTEARESGATWTQIGWRSA